LDGATDLGLGGASVAQKDEGVDFLNLLHGGLGGQGALDDRVLVLLRELDSGLSGVLRSLLDVAGGLGGAKAGGGADLGSLGRLGALDDLGALGGLRLLGQLGGLGVGLLDLGEGLSTIAGHFEIKSFYFLLVIF